MEKIENKVDDIFIDRGRQFVEEWEEKYLAPYACKSKSRHHTRVFEEIDDAHRTAFQRDRDRIIYSNSFRNLSDKRQVLIERNSERNRSRLTNTVEVVQVSKAIAQAMGLNEDLTEAIALGHDLGHPPFGFMGEEVLDEILSGEDRVDNVLTGQDYGGFKHNYQSLRVVDKLEKKYGYEGLNLTAVVREGILKHTSTRCEKYNYPGTNLDGLHYEHLMSLTLEGQVAAIADQIAQRTYDLEDIVRANYISLKDLRGIKIIQEVEQEYKIEPLWNSNTDEYINLLVSGLVRMMVSDVIDNTIRRIEDFCRRKNRLSDFDEWLVIFSLEVNRKQKELDMFIQKELGNNFQVNRANSKSQKVVRKLFKAYYTNPLQMDDKFLGRYTSKKVDVQFDLRKLPTKLVREKIKEFQQDPLYARHIADYVASMTDSFAIQEYKAIYIPEITHL
ncbi:dNTP triphosphohydrolase [bacterium]|nr:dNTP triphosphohydrolase [bacterium]